MNILKFSAAPQNLSEDTNTPVGIQLDIPDLESMELYAD
jgi:hypothetical protein